MIRIALGLLLLVGFLALLSDPRMVSAQKGGNSGTISKVDAKSGVITINMLIVSKKKKELTDKEYSLEDDAKVVIADGGVKKSMTGKEALTAGVLKPGTTVTFVAENDIKIRELTVGVIGKK